MRQQKLQLRFLVLNLPCGVPCRLDKLGEGRIIDADVRWERKPFNAAGQRIAQNFVATFSDRHATVLSNSRFFRFNLVKQAAQKLICVAAREGAVYDLPFDWRRQSGRAARQAGGETLAAAVVFHARCVFASLQGETHGDDFCAKPILDVFELCVEFVS